MIIRSARPESNFYLLDKTISEDKKLSWAARGLLIFLLGKPDNWRVSVEYLSQQTNESAKKTGKQGVYSLLDELIAVGYVVRSDKQAHDEKTGFLLGYDYVVYDSPCRPQPCKVEPCKVEPCKANRTLISIESKQGLNETKKNSASASFDKKTEDDNYIEKLKQGQFAKPDTFQITFDWKPSENFETRCKMAGKDFTKFNDDILLSFINYNESREQYKTQKEWEGLLLTAFTRELAKPAAKAQSTYKPFEKIVTPENASSASDFVATKKNTISEEEKARRKEFLAAQRQQNGEPA